MLEPNLDFYSTSAQVLPVVLLVLLFEARRDFPQRGARNAGFGLLLTAVATIFIVAGEVAALHVLSTKEPTDRAHDAVNAGFAFGGAAIASFVIATRMHEVPALRENAWLRVAVYAGWWAALGFALQYTT